MSREGDNQMRWKCQLAAVQREMEADSGERGPTKAENLVQYALEQVEDEIKQAREGEDRG